jgi:hypothetical protein
MTDPIARGMLQPLENAINKAFEYIGEKCQMVIDAIGGWLDNMFNGLRSMEKSALINVEGIGSKLNPANWGRQNSPSPDATPSQPKLGRNAHHHAISIGSPEKMPISMPEQTMSRHQGAISEFKSIFGGDIGIQVPEANLGNISAPSCPHFGNSFGQMAFAR